MTDSLIAALVLAASVMPGGAGSAPSVAGISLTYHHPRWRDVVECPGHSKLALHGECWLKVDAELEPELCRQLSTDGEEDSERRGNCPEPKPHFGFK
jgi:hypothetical protein